MRDYVCGILVPLGLTLICKAVYKLNTIEEAEKHFQTLQKQEPSPTKDESKKRRGRPKKTTTVPIPVRQTRNSAAQAKLTSDLKMLDSSIVNSIPTESSNQPKQTRIRTKQATPDATQTPTNSAKEHAIGLIANAKKPKFFEENHDFWNLKKKIPKMSQIP